MEVELTPDQKAFIRQAIESGRLRREEDAVTEALSLWEEGERRRLEILVAVDRAEASLARGEGRRVTTEAEAYSLPRISSAAECRALLQDRIHAHERISPCDDDAVLILHVVHSSRDIIRLFGD